MKIKLAAILVSVVISAAAAVYGQSTGSTDKSPAGSDVKKAAKTTTQDTKKVATTTGHTAKTAAKETATESKTVAKKTGHATKTAAKDTAKDTKKAADKTADAVK